MSRQLALLAASASLALAATIPVVSRGTGAGITPHEQYSSSVGVVGCKINTNRVAYWPSAVDCNDICVKVTYKDRSLHILKIDTSGGAYDISYDAWNYLAFGQSAKDDPHTGGAIHMKYEVVEPSKCADLMDNGKLPLLAANSMDFLSSCLSQADSFVAQNYVLYNIADPVCHYGVDEVCSLDLSVSNQPSCPSGLGSTAPLDEPVYNIEFGTGKEVVA
ncbi:hypothetical protein F9C07_2278522 [Aspergillus flavus]|uniref:Cerato-platanin n=2 Tax=Aspergillus subgen. Circumdati TaxID=2720871 RepID=A0A7G5JTE9_ASPFN|nr:uncharacterized protein G4B84_002057 [Aspergillus flavus NRRL3357]KJJ36625.1 hypothetical protein AFLA70_833g000130 [Aspergillus flavus AF70]PIG80995.1 hypothetical protein AARAC_011526 [Aspergillus arachidicola]QMW38891.1 hypothetical protein G4B11_002127 [Aspergillus flavus]GMG17637.1 unnamed protein product [Aspergillus oryzae]KAF7627391.1 hypothetical protein AFLA_002772 [Aspergillus flavus NRRL3357]